MMIERVSKRIGNNYKGVVDVNSRQKRNGKCDVCTMNGGLILILNRDLGKGWNVFSMREPESVRKQKGKERKGEEKETKKEET